MRDGASLLLGSAMVKCGRKQEFQAGEFSEDLGNGAP
jgi:hypothetical protein